MLAFVSCGRCVAFPLLNKSGSASDIQHLSDAPSCSLIHLAISGKGETERERESLLLFFPHCTAGRIVDHLLKQKKIHPKDLITSCLSHLVFLLNLRIYCITGFVIDAGY